ncbi:MAG TPA: DUF885 domain-containing protein [Planctomycetota bacterium]|nr:DUF885 domain-containing protein [Planctomycetota bacterium]
MAATANDSVKEFRRVSEKYVEESFERFPTYGSTVGRKEFHGELEIPSIKLFAAHEKAIRKTLAAVQDLPEHDFGGDDWLDRRAFMADLRSELWSIERIAFRRNPDTWASGALGAIHHHIVRHADDLSPVADAILSRLKKLPAYLEGAGEVLQSPVPVWQKMALSSCKGAPSLFDAIVEPLAKTGKAPKEKIEKLAAGAKSAFAAYAKRVEKARPGKPNDFSVGTTRFEALIRERMGWELTVTEAEAIGKTLAARIGAEMEAEAKKFSPTKKAHEILADAAANWKPERGDLLSEYQYQTTRVAEAFKQRDLVTFPPGERLEVKPVPDFLRHHFPTAAYSSPGAFEEDQFGIFWVNDLSLIRKTQKEKDAEIRQHHGLAATCAHEAYPGHHLQFCTANRHPSKLRRLFAHAIFYEGWTLWCEQMTVDYNVNEEPTAKLNQLHDALWRAHRILIDCGLQTGSMSYDDAVKHLMKHVGFTRGRAEGDVNWYTMSPTTPMSYLLGRTELLRLKKKKVDQGGWSVKQFNDWILSFGTLPWRWMELSGL